MQSHRQRYYIMSYVKYNVTDFGHVLQNANLDKIVSISWPVGEDLDDDGPEFFLLENITSFIGIIGTEYTINNDGVEMYTKTIPMIHFDDSNLTITCITYKYTGSIYKFFDSKTYIKIKEQLLNK